MCVYFTIQVEKMILDLRVLMVGQFPFPITGEAQSNVAILEFLTRKGTNVTIVNSSLVDTVNDVGLFSLKKVTRLLGVYLSFFSKIYFSDVIYLTPGQTLLGYIRFFPLVLFSLLFGKKVILHWHGYGVLKLAARYKVVDFVYFNKKVKHIFLTTDLASKMEKLKGITNFRVVKNFFKPHFDSEVRNVLSRFAVQQTYKKRINVLYLGGLMRQKGIEAIVDASKKTQDFDFTFCGSGDSQIVKKFTELSNEGIISYKGVVTGQQKVDAFQEADIFVLPTFYPTEGVPLTIIEAMSYGLCVVTTRHNGIPETVGDSAIFVEPNDPDSLLTVLNELNTNREMLLDYKKRSLERAKIFSLAEFENTMFDILSKA